MPKVSSRVADDADFLLQSERGAANGVASLDAGGKVPTGQLPVLSGGLDFLGTWNASTNTPALSNGSGTDPGEFYVIATAGTTAIDGISDWGVADWIIFDGTVWRKIDNSEIVASVFGRTGAVVAASGDYDAGQITETAGAKIMTSAERTKLSGIETAADVTDATNVAAAGAVMDADFDANTILKADSDNTPAALTVGEQTLVGRITAGVIAALTAAQVRTLINVADGANAYVHPNHSGDVTSVADGAQTIAAGAVTLAKQADVGAHTVFMRNSVSTGSPQAVKISALTEELSPTAGDFALVEEAGGALRKVDLGNLTGPGVSTFNGRSGTVTPATSDYDAVQVDFTPAGSLAATDVQAALAELDSEKQPLDAELTAIAGLTSAANKLPYFTGVGTAAVTDLTAAARTILDDATVGAILTTIGGQPLDAELTAIAGLTSAADKLPYFTGSGTAALATVTAAARTILDDTTVAAILATIGGIGSLVADTTPELGGQLDGLGNTAIDVGVAINDQTGTTYTLVASDAGKYVRCSNASAITLTVPPNSSVAFATGTRVHVRQVGAGQVTIAQGAGVTISTPETLLLAKQGATATLVKTGTNAWDLMGNLVAA